MKSLALTSVIIPVYNVEDCLSDCIESVLSQTFKYVEIVLVDDGSTDNSGNICDSYATKFDNIVVIHKTNEGVNYARRDGFNASNGEYITFIDADDIIDLDFISSHLDLLKKTFTDFTICKTHTFYGELLPLSEIEQCKFKGASADCTVLNDKKTILSAFMTSLSPYKNIAMMCVWGKLYRRELVEKVNWKISNYSHEEDYFVSAQIFNLADSVCLVSEYGYYYRKNRVGKLTQNVQYNTAPSGKKIDNLAHIPLLVKVYKDIADRNNLNLDKEVVIFQCRLYVYWLNKIIGRKELDTITWNKYIRKNLIPLIPVIKSTSFRNYMCKNLFYGGELYENLCNKLTPVYEASGIEQYLQHIIYVAKGCTEIQQNYINYDSAWVIMDRPDSATDNGYYFYKWIRKNHPEINAFFVINRDSKDVPSLKLEHFNLVYTNTEQHRQLLNNCSVEIYAFYTFNLCPGRTSFNSLKVYLGHGFKKDNSLNPGLSVNDLFVTTLKRESSFYTKNHDDFKTILTGMPRLESLVMEIDQPKDKIIIAPTWRRWLSKKTDHNANYFVQWSSVVGSKELKLLSKKYEVVFMVHPEVEDLIDLFKIPKYVKTIRYGDLGPKKIQCLIKKSILLITDYSSVSFDYALTGSELIYFQFDKDDFYNNHTAKVGWYDYEKDGFGPVFYSSNELLRYVTTENFNNETTKKVYKKRLADLTKGCPEALVHPSRNIYEQIVDNNMCVI